MSMSTWQGSPCRGCRAIMLVVAAMLLCASTPAYANVRSGFLDYVTSFNRRNLAPAGTCPQWHASGQGLTSEDRAEPLNVFSDLTKEEYEKVAAFIYSRKELNVTDQNKVTGWTQEHISINYIHGMWYEVPKKADVLKHLDAKGSKPPRFARVLLVMGAAKPAVVREVLVDLPQPSKYIPVKIHSTNRDTLTMWHRPKGLMDDVGWQVALFPHYEQLNFFFRQAFDNHTLATLADCGTKCLATNDGCFQYLNATYPRASYIWLIKYMQDGHGGYLHPLPFQFLAVAQGKDLRDWKIARVWFNFTWYESPTALVKAWNDTSTGLKKNWKWRWPTPEESYFDSFMPRPGPKRGADKPVGPVPHEPFGRRFTISQGNKIEWLGWSLYLNDLPTSGPRLFDVRFKGQRIAYEIALQEALADYGGADLTQANTLYLDSQWGLGSSSRELLHGLDCPANAAYISHRTWFKGQENSVNHKNSICVFESDAAFPIQRHYSYSYDFYGGIKNWVLTIRTVAEVFNYDYIHDVYLYVDGSLEVKVHTSGYVQATVQNNRFPNRYGYPLIWNIGGTIHNHHLAWKVDLDIAGVKNAARIHEVKMEKVDTGLGGKRYAHYYDVKTCETEDDCPIISNYATPKIPVIVNLAAKNKFGIPRGYKVQVNRVAHELMPDDEPYKRSLGFAKYTFAVTKHKDQEMASSSIYNQGWLANPVLRLEDYINGEKIVNEDLVAWVSAGLFHIPIAEDAPVTPTNGNNIGFSLIPFNYDNENAATDMADMTFTTKELKTTPLITNANKCKSEYVPIPFAVNNRFPGP